MKEVQGLTKDQINNLHTNFRQGLLGLKEICKDENVSSYVNGPDLNDIIAVLAVTYYVSRIKDQVYEIDKMLQILTRIGIMKERETNEVKFN